MLPQSSMKTGGWNHHRYHRHDDTRTALSEESVKQSDSPPLLLFIHTACLYIWPHLSAVKRKAGKQKRKTRDTLLVQLARFISNDSLFSSDTQHLLFVTDGTAPNDREGPPPRSLTFPSDWRRRETRAEA